MQSGTLNLANFNQIAGSTRLAGGTLSGSPLNFNGGTLSGNGNISGSIVNAAEISPGGSPGMLTINGSYTQTAAGRLTVELGDMSPGTHLLTALAQDDAGGSRCATQSVTVVSLPLHMLQAAGFRTNGVFKLCMQGIAEHVYQVFAIDEPGGTNWIPIGLMEHVDDTMRILDADATTRSQRFYHAEQWP